MKLKKIARRLAGALLAGTLMVSMLGMTAFAKTGNVTGGEVSFKKTLDMTNAQGASVPAVTFTYSITSGTAVPATDNNPEIKAGIGTPEVGTAVYAPVDDANTEVDETALVKTVGVDFSNVTFTAPGIYRYVITENTTDNVDITNDTANVRYLDVYVVNGANGGFEIASQALLTEAIRPNTSSSYDSTKKSEGFTNAYTTYKLTLDKVVDGTMGYKGEEFDFTINFEGPANASFTYGTTKVTLDNEGKRSISGIKLADATEPITVTGIPSTVKYTVVENIEKTEGYTTTAVVNEDANTVTPSEHAQTLTQVTMGKADNAVVVTNTKNATTPTGVILNIAPYILMVALAGILAFFFLRRRKSEF